MSAIVDKVVALTFTAIIGGSLTDATVRITTTVFVVMNRALLQRNLISSASLV